MPIGVMREDARACGSRDRAGTCFSEAFENGSDFVPIGRNEHFAIRFEEVFDAGPFVRDQTGLCSRGLEDARRWREAVARHAVAINVERREPGAEEGVVRGRADMTDVPHVYWYRFILPTGAAEQEVAARTQAGRFQEEFFHACLPVRQPIAEKAEIAGEPEIAWNRMMRLR